VAAPGLEVVEDDALEPAEEARIRAEIVTLREEHQDLDDAVRALESLPMPDQLRIARLKKKKLVLRDQIASLEDRLTPDIIA
jgi:hypothetical protein